MADSKGNIEYADKKKPLSGSQQKENLLKFTDFMQDCLISTGIRTVPEYFDTMIQPLGEYDGLLCFGKIPIDSSAKILRKKIDFLNGVYTPEHEEKMILQSIMEVRENGKPCWYQLMVNKILLQRNMFDNQWITVRLDKPVLYASFKENWNSMVYRKGVHETTDSFILLSKRNYGNTDMLIQTAPLQEQFENAAETILLLYMNDMLSDSDIYSNDKSIFLYELMQEKTDSSKIYFDFAMMRKFLKMQTGKRAYLHYEQQDLLWNTGQENIRIHVCKNQRYNVYGYFYSIHELTQQIASNMPLRTKVWYSALLPFFNDKRYTGKEERK